MNYSTERENNIIKNIAKEIVIECSQIGLDVSQELADTVVKLKLLNPKNGFTASEVMPRYLTQQLVNLIVEELKQENPGMDCIRMQVYWESVKMNVAELKKEFMTASEEKAEGLVNEILPLDRDEGSKMIRLLVSYVLLVFNMESNNAATDLKETVAAIQSVFKVRDPTAYEAYSSLTTEQKAQKIRTLAKTIAGIRLYLKHIGKAGEGIEDVNDLPDRVESMATDASAFSRRLTAKIDDIQDVVSIIAPIHTIMTDLADVTPYLENLPPDCDENDLKYMKKVLAIMIQHRVYMNDILSKLDEIDGDVSYYLQEFNDVLQKLNGVIRDRDAVPTTEVYDGFIKAAENWLEIQAYKYSFGCISNIVEKLESINKKEYFFQSPLEKAFTDRVREEENKRRKSWAAPKLGTASAVFRSDEEIQVEFNGFCAWTLYYVEGMLTPVVPEAGIYHQDGLVYGFSSTFARDLWSKDPQYCLLEVYQNIRNNPELVFLLNAYDQLYQAKSIMVTKKQEKKISIRKEITQTIPHPVPEYWDKDYTFSVWELRKRALNLARVVKCATKSVQTTGPHSNFKASIGLLAAPDKDKEVQTKTDSSCNHATIANYLYGLRGHHEDKFRVIELTRPVEETCQEVVVLEEGDTCRDRGQGKLNLWSDIKGNPCMSDSSTDKCDFDYYSSDICELLNTYGEE